MSFQHFAQQVVVGATEQSIDEFLGIAGESVEDLIASYSGRPLFGQPQSQGQPHNVSFVTHLPLNNNLK